MSGELLKLPIGVQTFELLRTQGCLYVDKTARLLELAETVGRYFLSRPRRFGKSLTLSTLDAMFSGKADLFKGLAAEAWVREQAKHPCPVLRFDVSGLRPYSTAEELDASLADGLMDFARIHDIDIPQERTGGGMLLRVIHNLFRAGGPVVVLIDEYDKPILDNVGNLEKASVMRQTLRSFYTVLKSCDEYLRFVMLTGISKFSKAGVFSAMNNLNDISMDWQYGDIVGYTYPELERDFDAWIVATTQALSLTRRQLFKKIENYYDGFCFDGKKKIYNPFSILNFFSKREFRNYWYTSGAPSFIVSYMRQHAIQSPEEYRHIEVPEDFADAQEIERAKPESFLYQSGYLAIEKKEEGCLILDYPNREVLDSLSRMYLEYVYHVESYLSLGSELWRAMRDGDMEKAVALYNTALASIPYEDYRGQGESWYRSLFLMLLYGAGITANGEVHTNRGRSDVTVRFPGQITVLEFKYAKESSDVDRMRQEGERQIRERNYAGPYATEGCHVMTAVMVINWTIVNIVDTN